MTLLCKGRAKHSESAARSVAFMYNEQGKVKFVAERCKDCSKWHVEKEKTNVKR